MDQTQFTNLWEEKNSTDYQKKLEISGVEEEIGIIKNTEKKSKKENACDTIQKTWVKTWVKNCPTCSREIVYFDNWQYKDSILKNRNCKSCRTRILRTGKKLSASAKLKISIKNRGRKTWLGKKLSNDHKQKLSEYRKNHPILITEEQRQKRRLLMVGNVYRKGIPHNAATKERIRTSMKERVKNDNFLNVVKNKFIPNFNKKACLYFDSLNEYNNWSLRHALNGGEVKIQGYWLDAYDQEKNIVVEYDETRHYDRNGKLKEKDMKRMLELKNLLNCKFYRYDEKIDELVEY